MDDKADMNSIRHFIFFFILILSPLFCPAGWADPRHPTNHFLGNPPSLASLICQNDSCRSVGGLEFNYLIVTRPIFVSALTPFINWKTSQGYRVGLVTVEWLDQNFSGRHMAEKMKAGLHFLRRNSGVQYVLLVGDTSVGNVGGVTPPSAFEDSLGIVDIGNITPERMRYSYNLTQPWNVPTGFYRRLPSDPPQVILPSDAYFVEDRNWDPENTGLNLITNREDGSGQLNASLFLGRWPVRSPGEINSIFQKTRSVSPATSIFFTQNTPAPDAHVIECPHVWPPAENDRFFCYLNQMDVVRPRLFEANTPWLRTESLWADPDDPVQSRNLQERLFSAQGIVSQTYHGSHACLRLSEECFHIEQIAFRYVFPLMEIGSCLIDSFYWDQTYGERDDSLAEALLRAPTGPAVITGSPNPYMFFNGLLEGKTVGEAFWRSGQTYVYWPNPVTLLGDPSLKVLQTYTPEKIKLPPINYRKLEFPKVIPPDPKAENSK